MRDANPARVVGLLLCLGAVPTASCVDDTRPAAGHPGATTIQGAAGDPSITILAPSNNISLPTDQPLDVAMAVSVSNAVVGPDDLHIRYYRNGLLAADKTDVAPFSFIVLPCGYHHLAARLVTATGDPLPNEESLAAVLVKVICDCEVTDDCEEGHACTDQFCNAGTCSYGPVDGCCEHDLQCPYGWTCGDGVCLQCLGDADCDDGDLCTDDVCAEDGLCYHPVIEGCCTTDGDCDDGLFCTTDTCLDNHTCQHTESADPTCCNTTADCVPPDPCQQSLCYYHSKSNKQWCRYGPPTFGCCDQDADCSDGNPCTEDTCELENEGDPTGTCVFADLPQVLACCITDAACDDGDPATIDACVSYTCTHIVDPDYCALPETSAIVFNELMVATGDVSDGLGEWLELYNASDELIDLTGWTLATSEGTHTLVPQHVVGSPALLVLLPDTYLVLGRTADPTLNGGFVPHYVYGNDLALPDFWDLSPETGTTLTLRDAEGAVVDLVTYEAGAWPVEDARSLELTHPWADNDDPASWRASGHNAKVALNKQYGLKTFGLYGSPKTENVSSLAGLPHPGCVVGEGEHPCAVGVCGTDSRCDFPLEAGCCLTDDDCGTDDVCFASECSQATQTCTPPAFVEGCCKADSECDDENPCNIDRCLANVCRYSPDFVPGCCSGDAGCEDGDPCLVNVCDLGTHTCEDPVPIEEVTGQQCCSANAECDDGDPGTLNLCDPTQSVCVYPGDPEFCNTLIAPCDDQDVCTADACDLPNKVCVHAPIDGCCKVSLDCKDGLVCTDDVCDVSTGACSNPPIDGCCTDDAQCEDGLPCTTDLCGVTNVCHNIAIGTCCDDAGDCDDGSACTVDACVGGVCSWSGDGCCTLGGSPTTLQAECGDDPDGAAPCWVWTCTDEGSCLAVENDACCSDHAECEDSDACTVDLCGGDGLCKNLPTGVDGCCNDATECPDTDGDPCTVPTCADAVCGEPAIPGCVPGVDPPYEPHPDTFEADAAGSCWAVATGAPLGPDDHLRCDGSAGALDTIATPGFDPRGHDAVSFQARVAWDDPGPGAHTLEVLASTAGGSFAGATVLDVVDLVGAQPGRTLGWTLPENLAAAPKLWLGFRVQSASPAAIDLSLDDVVVAVGHPPYFVTDLVAFQQYDREVHEVLASGPHLAPAGGTASFLLRAHDPEAATQGLLIELVGCPGFVSVDASALLFAFAVEEATVRAQPSAIEGVGAHTCAARVSDGAFTTEIPLDVVVNLGAGCPGGPVVTLPFDGSLEDASGYGHDAALIGPGGFVPGHVGDAYGFDGASTRLRLPLTDLTQIPSDGVTVMAWIRPDAGAPGASIVHKGNHYALYRYAGGPITFAVGGAGWCFPCVGAHGFTPDDAWSHVAATWDSATVRLYVDGVEAGAVPLDGTLASDPSLPYVGCYAGDSGGADCEAGWFAGAVDDALIFPRALDAAEIAAIVGGGAPGVEVCNGLDDDCDGEVDEASGVPEVCNGIDDDCDGEIDEDFGAGLACDGPDADGCAKGALTCTVDGTTTECVETPAIGTAPVTYLPLDDLAGDTASDVAGAGHHGAIAGGAVWGNVAAVGPGALHLDGADDAVQVPTDGLSNKAGTIALWLRPDGWDGDDLEARGIFQTDSGVNSLNWLTLFKWTGKTFYFRIGAAGNCCINDLLFDPSPYLHDGQWVHVVATWDQAADQMRVYFDGELQASRGGITWDAPAIATTGTLGLGHDQRWRGWMDDAAFWDVALDASQVANLYADGVDAKHVAVEVCDGVDNDCDGVADEDLATVPETCNGADDDCDGGTDEDFGVGGPCDDDDDDLCEEGVAACLPDFSGATCVADGPLWFLPFEEGAGLDTLDVTTSGHDGTLGGTTWSTEGHDGGTAVYMDGSTDFVEVPTDGLTNRAGTLAVWLRPDGWGGTDSLARGIFQTESGVNSENWLTLFKWTGNIFYFRMGANGNCCSNDLTFQPGPYFVDGQWTHVAATWDQATDHMRVYMNGVLVAERSNVSWSGPPIHPTARWGAGHNQWWKGEMDDAVAFDRALTAAEIATLHADGVDAKYVNVEVCDGIDNDCDGQTDETAAVELCDGLDNDCDGKTDEDFVLGGPCDGFDADVCIEGTVQCSIDQLGTRCVEEGPLSFLAFEEGGGAQAYDATTNGLHGTLGGAEWTTQSKGGSGAVYLDGFADHVQVPTDGMSNKSGTVAVWVRPDGWSGDDPKAHGIWQTQSGVNSLSWVTIFKWSGNIFYFRLGGSKGCCGNDLTFQPAPYLVDGQWTHVVATWDQYDDAMKVYMDGVLVAQRSSIDWTGPAIHGTARWGVGHDQWWKGELDEAMTFDHALDEDEVLELYENGVSPAHLNVEVCDGEDNDCDGSVDENAVAELCNGVDDDCDGQADEDFTLGGACDGDDEDLCIEGIIACALDGQGTRCVEAGPLSYLPFEEGAGVEAKDATTNGNHGTLGGTTWSTDPKVGSGAVYMDGFTDFVEVPTAGMSNKSGSLAVWLRPDGWNGDDPKQRGIFQTQSGVNSLNWLTVFKWTGDIFYFRLGNASSCCTNDLTFKPAPYLQDGVWTHLVATWDEAEDAMIVYLDGVPVASRSAVDWSGPPIHATARWGVGHDQWWLGDMDEAMVFDHALSQDEVTDLFLNGVPPEHLNEEVCDGVDNDCDGEVDENAAPELCNGVDDDCDGLVDEDFVLGGACDGDDEDVCIEGVVECALDGVGTRCVEAGPLSYLPFEEGAGVTAKDATTNGNHGTLGGTTWTTEAHGGAGAVYLDGFTDFVELPTDGMSNKSGTIAVWVRPDGWSGGDAQARGIFQTQSGVNSLNWLTIFKWSGDIFYFRMGNSKSCCTNDLTFKPAPYLLDGQWTFVVATWDESEDAMKVYMDGEVVAQRSTIDWSGPPIHATARFGVGHDQWWKGELDEAMVFDHALDEAEVLDLYLNGVPAEHLNEEVCDGLDNDCDGAVNENAVAELCNGIDDDCDEQVDEDFSLGGACDGDDEDVCVEGVIECALDGVGTRCVEAGPVSYLTFEEGAGPTAYDATTHGNHGTLAGAEWGDDAKVGAGSVSMDGFTDFVEIPTTGVSNKSGTLAVWVKPEGWSGADAKARGIFQTQSGVNSLNWLTIFKWSGDIFYFRMGNSSSCCTNDLTFKPGAYLQDGQWTHVVATWDESEDAMKVYMDGVVVAQRSTVDWSGPPIHATGRWGVGHDQWWLGEMDEAMAFDHALDEAEVLELFTSGVPAAHINVEVCDGADNDCDGGVDENAEVELCNDVDDDCDGLTDEDFALGGACDGGDEDLCVEGTVQCSLDGLDTRCVEAGPSSYLPFEELAGPTASDATTNGNHGTLGGTQWSTDAKVGGGAVRMDGVTDFVEVPTDGLSNKSGTLAVWVRPEGWSGGDSKARGIFQTQSGVNSVNWLTIFKWSGDIFYFRLGNASSCCTNDLTFKPAPYLQDGQWTHVVATWDEAEDAMKVYMDGQVVAQRTTINWSGPPIHATGRWGAGHDQWWLGQMDEAMTFDHALDEADVLDLYLNGVSSVHLNEEICDGADNDCDGSVDENSQAELCNGVDDDCDGQTDEDFALGDPCDGDDADLCVEGTVLCSVDGLDTRCVEDGPVTYLPFEELGGVTALDATTNGNHGTLAGTSWTFDAHTGVGAVSMDGATDFVEVPTDGLSNKYGSIAVWVRPDGWSGGDSKARGIFQTQSGVNSLNWLTIFKWSGDIFYFRMGNASSCCTNDLTFKPAPYLLDGAWTHVVATWDRDQDAMVVYMNGEVVAQRSTVAWDGPPIHATARFGVGHDQWWLGEMDEAMLFDHALSAEQVTDLFLDGVPPEHLNEEVCDDTDNDCDGEVDENAVEELCNGLDDDCDGGTDETFVLGGSCDGGDGDLCTEGSIACSLDGGSTVCAEAGPITWLPADEGAGATAADVTSWDHHGSLGGDASWSLDPKLGASAVTLDGAGDHVEVPTAGLTNKSGTISVWVRPDGWSGADPAARGIFQTESGVNSLNWLTIFKWSGDIFYFRMGNASSCCTNDLTFKPAPYLVDGQWTHVVATWDEGEDAMKVYMDGVLVAQRSTVNWSAAPLHPVARFGVGHATWWKGDLDEMALFDHALDAGEVLALFADGIHPGHANVEVCNGADDDCDGDVDEGGVCD